MGVFLLWFVISCFFKFGLSILVQQLKVIVCIITEHVEFQYPVYQVFYDSCGLCRVT